MKYLFAILILASCESEHRWSIDDAFTVYVDDFYNEAWKRGIRIQKENLVVQFGSIKASGEAWKHIDQRFVTIDIMDWKSDWQARTDDVHRFLIFHELGHCILGRHHTDKYSIMNPKGPIDAFHYNADQRERLIDELFNYIRSIKQSTLNPKK